MIIGRNDKCWCGSGKKYKSCHMGFDEKIKEFKAKGYEVPHRSLIKTPEQIEKIKASAKINNEILDLVGQQIKAGMTTNDIDKIVHDYTISQGAVPAPLGYSGFPKSCCTSINDQICHGIPDETVLKDGDIINVVVSTILDGYYSDASRMYMIGEVSDNSKSEWLAPNIENFSRFIELLRSRVNKACFWAVVVLPQPLGPERKTKQLFLSKAFTSSSMYLLK